MGVASECKTCRSKKPNLHPSMQVGGEVEICVAPFHLIPTPENKPEYIALVKQKRAATGLPS